MKIKIQKSNNRAVALVIVLCFLVIISALAVAFFASVTTELRASKNFQNNVNTRQLQDSVVNIVEGQIRMATNGTGNVNTQNSTWASQPGMITAFGDGNGNVSPNIAACYKLYSSNQMTVPGAGSPTPPQSLVGDYSATYDQNPAVWTDLNSPVWVQDPTTIGVAGAAPQYLPRFPVIDPRSYIKSTYPVVPGTTLSDLVEGFSYSNSSAASGQSIDGVVVDSSETGGGNGNSDLLAMPVRWMYVLKDGSLTAPTGAGTGTTNGAIQASWVGSTSTNIPSSSNPIVGRVAFWTDDDSCKVNVNTAGGAVWTQTDQASTGYTSSQWAGSYWDTPRFTSTFDEGQVYGPNVSGYNSGTSGNGGTPLPNMGGLATVQMIQNEFQRYPGHPAQVSLALILRNLFAGAGGPPAEHLYQLTPRITYGSLVPVNGLPSTSVEGTNRLHIAPSGTPVPGAATSGVTLNQPLTIRYDRLYASVDELLFAQDKTWSNPPNPRKLSATAIQLTQPTSYNSSNVNDPTQFTPGLLDRLRFFITAYNRAPELNLFGHPRISVWPIRSQTFTADTTPTQSGVNAYDSLSLFCSTIGPAVYNYTGNNSYSPYSSQPFASAAAPNFGTSAWANVINPPFRYSIFRHEITTATVPTATTNPPLDVNLPRNQDLLQYLMNLTSGSNMSIPGFGGSFGAKYGTANMAETLVEMFDYIRCANLYDTTITVPNVPNPNNLNPAPGANPYPFAPTGIVMPTIGNLAGGQQLGMGRFPTVSEATILFYYSGSDTTIQPTAQFTTASSPYTNVNCYQIAQTANTSLVTGVNVNGSFIFNGGTASPVSGTTQEYNENSGVLVIIPPMTPYAVPAVPPSTTSKPPQFPKERHMRAAFILSTFNPMQGYGPIQTPIPGWPQAGNQHPMVMLSVSGLSNFSVAAGPAGNEPLTSTSATKPFPTDAGIVYLGATGSVPNGWGGLWGTRNFGGFEGFVSGLFNASTFTGTGTSASPVQGAYPLITPWNAPIRFQVLPANLLYPPLTAPPTAVGAAPYGAANAAGTNSTADYQEAVQPNFTLNFPTGKTVQVQVLYGSPSNPSAAAIIQTIQIPFPATQVLPTPRGDDIIDAEPFKVTATGGSTSSAPILTPVLNNGFPVLANTTGTVSGSTYATPVDNISQTGLPTPQPYGQLRRWYWGMDAGGFDPNAARTTPAHPSGSSVPPSFSNSGAAGTPWARTVGAARDFQLRINWVLNGPTYGSNSWNPVTVQPSAATIGWLGNRWRNIVQPGDTVRSMIFCNLPTTSTGGTATMSGDLRLASITNTINAPISATATAPGFYPHPDYTSTTMRQACLLRNGDTSLYFNYAADNFFNNSTLMAASTTGWGPIGYANGAQNGTSAPAFSNQIPFGNHLNLATLNSVKAQFQAAASVGNLPRKLSAPLLSTPVMVNGLLTQGGFAGDFDTGLGSYPDGPYFNKQDEGNAVFVYYDPSTGTITYPIPYFGSGDYAPPGSAFDAPNRQMPSAGMMGSLLSQAAPSTNPAHGWETLCFCPNPAAGASHNGNTNPKDHLMLDLFQMPIVQPYPISEPFSTAGKVNMNYQIQPFDYITRSTALRAAIATERVTLVGSNTSTTLSTAIAGSPAQPASSTTQPTYWVYKQQSTQTTTGNTGASNMMQLNPRYVIDRDQTVAEIAAYIKQNGVFKSPSQICEIFLIPTGASTIWTGISSGSFASIQSTALRNWQLTGDLTGDNLREKPYVDIYPHLTTKSNTYTIHMKVQALKQQPHGANSSLYQIWDESKDQVLGEYRGSATIERYIDPADRHFNPADATTRQNNDFVNPDLTTPTNSLESLYRFRTVNTKKFSP